jgi:anti-anti-sigma factor
MVANVHIPGETARIAMPNRFDFSMYRGFMKSYTSLLGNSAIREIEVELGAVDTLDSSALDMLMLLRERAASANKSIALLNTSIRVSRILELAHFRGMQFNVRQAA